MKVIIFTGLSASGKSSISRKVSQTLNIPRIDLHSILHKKAENGGFSRAREWVSSTGIPAALEETKASLVEQLDQLRNERGLIIDEILDLNTLDYLCDRFPEDSFTIVYIRTNRHDRKRFMAKRLGMYKDDKSILAEMIFMDRLKERLGIRDVISRASLRFENYGRLDSIVEKVTEKLNEFLEETSVRQERAY